MDESMAPSAVNDGVREVMADVRAALATKGADIASAGTTDLGAVAGLMHDITGTTTITGFGTVSAGIWKIVKFEGALTLTHNATSLILPGAANITTADGDTAIFMSEGSGNWRCINYKHAVDSKRVTAAGATTMPLQPAFLATGGGATDATGDGTVFNPVAFATEVYDQNGNYVTTGTFTAPSAGRYLLSAGISIDQLGANHNAAIMTIVTSNRSYTRILYACGAGANINTSFSGEMTVIADMDAADTAYVQLEVSGGTKTVDLTGTTYGRFSGCLLV
jgi:hypothetical protein